MVTATNIDVKQKLQSSSINKPNATSNLSNFGKRGHINTNSTPIKTFFNHSFSSIDSTIFSEVKLQFNIPTVKINYPLTFKPNISHNTSLYNCNINSYKQGSNISSENIPTYYNTVTDSNKNKSTYIINLESNYFTTFPLFTSPADLLPLSLEKIKKNKDKCFKDGRNFIWSLIALTTFSQIKNSTIVSITTETIPQFFKKFILMTTDILTHFMANWTSYVLHANKVTTTISSRLIQQNTYEQYVSAKEKALQAAIENSEYIVFFTHICKHLQNIDLLILYTNIKQLFNTLSLVILNIIKYNLA
jgi:hypothetical protein